MRTISLLTLVAALGIGTASMLHSGRHNYFPSPNESAGRATDGAFRDGLYVGKLAAERGAAPRIPIARRAALEDRSFFSAGYREGYNEFLASRASLAARGRRAE